MTIPLRFISFLRLGFQISPWSPHRITPKNVSNVTRIQAIPSRQDFRGANGGEFRKSFHGYPPGFAQVVASPTQFQITPMQMLGRSGKQKLLRDVIRMSSDYKCYTFGVCFGGVGWWIWWVISWCDDMRENVGRCLWHFVDAMEFGYTISFQFVTPRHAARIDTWNREKMNISHPTRFVPGPVPRTFSASVGSQIYHVLKIQIKVHHPKPLWIDRFV